MSVVAGVRESVRAGGLLQDASSIVAMLSGGRDSLCLLDVLVALRGRERVRALHVNYGLRGEESETDERHCRATCARLGVAIEVVDARGDSPEIGNLHAWARQLRYDAAHELLGDDERAVVASGHTASDQVETILYRLAASPGRRALLGMAPRTRWLVRPLLSIGRQETAEYCRERGLRWREDPSNDDRRYARARVRHELIPAFEAVHPAAQANLLRTAALLREETELLQGLVDGELRGHSEIALERLRELPAGLRRLVVVRLAEQAAGAHVPQAGERVDELLDLDGRGARAELHVGGLVSAVVEHGLLRMVRIPARAQH